MSESVHPNNTKLSEPAQDLLEQYKNYRDDGIVEIREPIICDKEQKEEKKRGIQNKNHKTKKQKRSAIINPLNSKKTKKINQTNVNNAYGGYDESWWDDLCNAENKAENDCKHKLNNIALMEKYEKEKDASPFNAQLQQVNYEHWENHFKQETEKIADEYFNKMDEKKNSNQTKKKTKKKVSFSPNLVTKQASSENVMDENITEKNIKKPSKKSSKKSSKKKSKKLKLPSKTKPYGNLVGFYNKKKNTNNNPYLDKELMKGCSDFTIDKNQLFEHKFDPKTNNNSNNNNEENTPAFNGQVFERKPPDMIYIHNKNEKNNQNNKSRQNTNIKPQTLPKIGQPKTSLFRKQMYCMEPNKAKQDICLLFLDVDGVLNCSYSPLLSKAHILRLKNILNKTNNCKICVSSAWRVNKQSRMKLLNGLKQFGDIDLDIIIGDTPKLHKNAWSCRPEEIKLYLQQDEFLNHNYNVLQWCAIDDIALDVVNKQHTEFMKHHFVKTNPQKGLTDYDMEKAIGILNGNNNKFKQIKLLFLDVDGVLNYVSLGSGVNGSLCVKCLFRLKYILEQTECKIVLSTSWRRIASAKQQLLHQLSKVSGINIHKYIIGDTPVLGSEMKKPMEICQYLKNIKNKYDIISWVALDDMPLDKIGNKKTKEMLRNHFVKTNVNIGLSDKNVKTAISILNCIK